MQAGGGAFAGIAWLHRSSGLSFKIGQIYARHMDEFTPSMVTEIRGLSMGYGQPQIDTRLFSLRGAHLLGMFARTSKGMQFRQWVLNQLGNGLAYVVAASCHKGECLHFRGVQFFGTDVWFGIILHRDYLNLSQNPTLGQGLMFQKR